MHTAFGFHRWHRYYTAHNSSRNRLLRCSKHRAQGKNCCNPRRPEAIGCISISNQQADSCLARMDKRFRFIEAERSGSKRLWQHRNLSEAINPTQTLERRNSLLRLDVRKLHHLTPLSVSVAMSLP